MLLYASRRASGSTLRHHNPTPFSCQLDLDVSCIPAGPGTRIPDIALCADVTERTAQRIVADLVEAGCVERHRLGGRNFYEIHPELPLRHGSKPASHLQARARKPAPATL